MSFKPFVPFRILSAYTMLEGAIDPKAMAKLAKEQRCKRAKCWPRLAFATWSW